MNSIVFSANEISALCDNLAEETKNLRVSYEALYDIKESIAFYPEDKKEISEERKLMMENCEVFEQFVGFAKNVCLEYRKCEEFVTETVESIRI